jgi:hypothetical protein
VVPALLATVALAACTGEIGSPHGQPTGGGEGTSGPGGVTTGGSSTGGSGGPTTGGTGGGSMPLDEVPSPRILRQLTLGEYQATIADLLHISNPDTTAIPPDVLVDGFTTNAAGIFVDQPHMDAYSSVGGSLADRAVNEAYASLVSCATQDNACAGQFVDQFGLRAFRRPLTSDEHTRYAALFDPTLTGGTFKTGVALAIKSMLISPNFLFRSELGSDDGKGNFALTPFEIATALSYSYWGTMPDDQLFAAAQAGELATKTQIEAQVRRLLADARGRDRVAHFFYEWLEAPRAYVATKDMGTYPQLFAAAGGESAIVDAMRAEEDAFITHVVFDSTKKFSELFTADYTFANDELAAYYGLPAPGTGTTAAKVSLAGSSRGGILTTGMFLLGHARTNQSSPTQRGHMIRANMLCSDVPPPPPNVDPTVQPGTPGKTGREQIEALTGSGICASCHGLMNPIGFGLENFDGAAQFRTLDGGETVDATGAINGFGPTPITFNGPKELASILAKNDTARSCLASNYYRYTRGFLPRDVDLGAVDKLAQDFVKGDLELPDLFVNVALQDSFTMRRSAEELDP